MLPARAQRKAAAANAASSNAARYPSLLLSFLDLPHEALLLCTSFAAVGDADTHHTLIEHARRVVHGSRDPGSVQNSLLPHVDASNPPKLHVFAIGSHTADTPAARALRQLRLPDMHGVF